MAAVSGTVIWATSGAGLVASAEERPTTNQGSGQLLVGRAMADITGEPWGAGMFGYAVGDQTSVGIQRRQYARAFIFAAADDPASAVVHVTLDVGLMFQSIHLEVLRRLRAIFGDRYGQHNVLLHATHTHVAPGGTSQHLMVDITHGGFRPRTFEATVAGTVDAIVRAHGDLSPAEVVVTENTVDDAGRNRSKQSFDRNPPEDKAALPGGVDNRCVTLLVTKNGTDVGLISWYSIHPTSFGPEYRHISGDNKGYAAWATEQSRGVNHREPEHAPFVAAFANSTPGDITPNHGLVPGSGPGATDNESARILGERMMAPATNPSGGRNLGGLIDGVFQWVDCPNLTADSRFTPDGQQHRLGPAILGAAFAASSQEDGGGVPELHLNEGERGGNPWIAEANKVLVPPEVMEVHRPKDNLLPMGYIPGMIQQTHPFFIHRIGGLVLASLGFEPTITSGLRLRRTISEALGVPMNSIVVQGYTNSYGHYITTPEEYEAQNYEGGATIFGKYELPAFQGVFDRLATALKDGRKVDPGSPAGDLTGLIPNAPGGYTWVDIPPLGKRFGDILRAPQEVAAGQQVSVEVVGANPNNNLRHGAGYLTIEDASGAIIADDSSESTLLTFSNSFGTTTVTIDWSTIGVKPGRYTIKYRGDAKGAFGPLSPFESVVEIPVR